MPDLLGPGWLWFNTRLCKLFTAVRKRLLCSPTDELYRGIFRNTVVPFPRQHFGDNYRYQDDKFTVLSSTLFPSAGQCYQDGTPARSPVCNPIEHIWDQLGRAITNMDNPPQNLGELRQDLLDKWVKIPVERLAAIIAARIPDTDLEYRRPHQRAVSCKKSSFFYQIYHNNHPITFRYAHAANFSNIYKCHHKFTKIYIK